MAFSVPVGRENSATDYCIMHGRSRVQGKLTTFTHASWCKCLNCASGWMKLDCKDGEIATKSASDLWLASDCMMIEYGGDAHRCTHYTYRSSCRFQQSTGFIENVIWNSATFKWLHVKGRDKKNMMRKTNTACWTWSEPVHAVSYKPCKIVVKILLYIISCELLPRKLTSNTKL